MEDYETDGYTKPPELPWRNPYAAQEATVRPGHGTTDWFQTLKAGHQGFVLSPCLFNVSAECIVRNAGLNEAQAGIQITGRNIKTSDMQVTLTLLHKVNRN